MKNYSILLAAAAVLGSCTPKASIDCTIAQAPESQIVVKQLNINVYNVLDTVKTDVSGRFTYKFDIKKGQPEFIYIFRGETKIAGVVLQRGDKVTVCADTLGSYTVEGSEDSENLRQIELDYSAFLSDMYYGGLDRQGLGKRYVDYYRSRVNYLMQNPCSVTTIPVLYQMLDQNTPIFCQPTDAIHFRRVCDSLAKYYPESSYVKALAKETDRREKKLALRTRIESAPQLGFADLDYPDIRGAKVSISSLEAKAVLVHFWSPADVAQKMFNLDVLKKVYADYKDKGLEIYAVGIDNDKVEWANVVKAQGLPWVNVNDGKGTKSSSIALYNVTQLPTSYLIVDGGISSANITGEAGLRKELDKVLK